MERVGAIGRLMAAIALLAVTLAIYRAWADPWRTIREHPLGEMALASLSILPSAALALVSRGWLGRFFGRLAGAGAVISVCCWLAPDPIREAILARVLIPIDQRFAPREARGLTHLEVSFLMTGYASSIAIVPRVPRGLPCPPSQLVPFSRQSMVELGIREAEVELTIVQMGLALAVALLDAAVRAVRRRLTPSTPPGIP